MDEALEYTLFKGEILISPSYYNKILNRIINNPTGIAYLQFTNDMRFRVYKFILDDGTIDALYIFCPPRTDERFILKSCNTLSGREMRIQSYIENTIDAVSTN